MGFSMVRARALGSWSWLVLASLTLACGGGPIAGIPSRSDGGATASGGGSGGTHAGAGGAPGSGAAGGVVSGGAGQGGPSGAGGAAPIDGGSSVEASSPAAPDPESLLPYSASLRAHACPAEEAQPRVVFDIPRAGDVSADFFRLPFPNDVRQRDGQLVLADFPRPFALPGFDVVDKVVRAIEAEKLGWGPNPVVIFRLTRPAAFDEKTGSAVAGAIAFVDLTPGLADSARVIPHRLRTLPAGRYLCARHLIVERERPLPLEAGHTYAVIVTDKLTDRDGQPFGRDVDFRVTMATTEPPTGAERKAAWRAYAPLRRYLTGIGGASAVVAAAVFTVTDAGAPAAGLRAAVQATAAPVVKDLVRCGPGATSICDDGRAAACGTISADAPFVEWRGRLEIPVFQQGVAPYDAAGGGIAYVDGRPQVVRREPVCFSLTLPKGMPPGAGWPIVLYGHGTGGHYRWAAETGLAAELAEGAMGAGAGVPMATLTFDGVLHGSRKNGSTRSTDELVYNPMNPTAARDNNLQAAADFFAFARALPQLRSAERAFDPTRVAAYGHSQGGNAAAIAVGYEPIFGAAVLSGTGGGIASSLLEKQKPIPSSTWLPFVVGESVTHTSHPVLALMQLYFDRADPINHGRRIAHAPMPGDGPRHLLHVLGADDQYAPVSTQLAFATAARLPVMNPVLAASALTHFEIVVAPVRKNFGLGVAKVTALEIQFSPSGYDGHFVSTHHPAAVTTIRRFLGSYFRDGIPVAE